MLNGEIQRCNSKVKLRQLRQMIGTWQIDDKEVKAKNFQLKIWESTKKDRKKPLRPLNYEKITKQVNIAFKGWKIWLPRTMASHCQKPKLLSSLQGILEVVNITMIDNVDFKETTFGYGNIFDAVRGNSHATLRMLIQYQLPELPEIFEEQEQNHQKLFGQNRFSQQTFYIFNSVFEKLLAFDGDFTSSYCSDFEIMIYVIKL
ncbi:hypothetical protein C1645_842363 [Glomus cerebriforme]|uniref:Uncharacterized protein n=1 Tax=Glomus cerebriforme TaxID=658196 RepID=A0A397S8Y9_9GLOM|nr:hypothetical protein C1645_842363 [Glomus cerebriforme]